MIGRFSIKYLFSLSKFDPKKDYYRVLNLTNAATPQDIKKSFKTLAKKYHPDNNSGNDTVFKEVNEAYQILGCEETKKEYDLSRGKSKDPTNQDNYRSHSDQRTSKYTSSQNQKQHSRSEYPKYDDYNPQKFREFARKKQEEDLRRYMEERRKYDDLGNSYDNYERFRKETLQRKKEQQMQKQKITLESIKRQQQEYRRRSKEREDQRNEQRKKAIKDDLEWRYKRGVENGQKTLEGMKRMYNTIKGFFSKK